MKSLKIQLAIVMMFVFVNNCIIMANPDYEHEVLTMFKRGTVTMPMGQVSAPVEQVLFDPPIIKNVLLNHKAQTISIAFPDYDPADSIIVSPRDPNLWFKQMELDLIYKIYLKNADQRVALNGELETHSEVLFSQKNGIAIVGV